MLYLLGIGSPTHPLPAASWRAWVRPTLTWDGTTYVTHAGPLFLHQYSHAWVDFRAWRDPDPPHDWFANSVAATRANRGYCLSLRDRFPGYEREPVGHHGVRRARRLQGVGRPAARSAGRRHGRAVRRGRLADVRARPHAAGAPAHEGALRRSPVRALRLRRRLPPDRELDQPGRDRHRPRHHAALGREPPHRQRVALVHGQPGDRRRRCGAPASRRRRRAGGARRRDRSRGLRAGRRSARGRAARGAGGPRRAAREPRRSLRGAARSPRRTASRCPTGCCAPPAPPPPARACRSCWCCTAPARSAPTTARSSRRSRWPGPATRRAPAIGAYVVVPQMPARSADYSGPADRRRAHLGGHRARVGDAGARSTRSSATLPIDRQRIGVVGFSMGASTTWNLLHARPGFFAAAIPIAGVPRADQAARCTPRRGSG